MDNVRQLIAAHMDKVKTAVQNRMVQAGRNASGKTSSSLRVECTDNSAVLFGAKSFLSIENGRGPGSVPRDFVSVIRNWIKVKGIAVKAIPSRRKSTIFPQDRGLNHMAGAIAHNIMTKGTRLYREKGHDDIFTSVLNEELRLMARDLTINLCDKVTLINDRIDETR